MNKLLCQVALAAIVTGSAAAQVTPAPAQPAPAASGGTSETVVVTARRREEEVQDVPAAVTGLSGAQLEDNGGVTDIKDLAFMLPGVALVDTGNINAENNIRGAGGGTARTGGVESPIAILRDGASISGGNFGGRTFTRTDLFDVERVEVVRGPQGALYGVNAVGGVMQVISKRPDEDWGASVNTSWSPDIERFSFDAIVNAPIEAADMAVRLGVQAAKKDKGFFYNAYKNEYGDIEEYTGVRGSVKWTPTDFLKATLIIDSSDDLSASNTIKSVNSKNDPTLAATAYGPDDIDGPFIYQANTPGYAKRTVNNVLGEVVIDTPIGELTSTSLLRARKTRTDSDFDQSAPGYATSPFPLATCASRLCTLGFVDDTEIASEDVKLAGGEGPLTWIVGANYAGRQMETATLIGGRTTSATNLAPSPTANSGSAFKEEEIQTGVFGTISWQATDAFTIDAAARWSRSEKKVDAYSIVRQPSATVNCAIAVVDPFNVFSINSACVRARNLDEQTFENTTPSLSAKYEINSSLRIFASAAQGYRSGGFNGNAVSDPNIAPNYKPEKNTAIEAGAKFEAFGGYYTVTAFQNQMDDLLVTVDSIGPDSVSRNSRFNAGKAKSYGVDFETFGRIGVPDTWGRVNYFGAVNWLQSEIESGPYSGKDIEGSPEFTYTANINWRKPIVGDWVFFSSAAYRGQRGGYTNTVNINNQVEMPDLDLFNATLGIEKGGWRATVEARNLFDETYVALRDPTRSFYGDPREIRFTLAWAFGSEAPRHR